jgi:hypothetical protein
LIDMAITQSVRQALAALAARIRYRKVERAQRRLILQGSTVLHARAAWGGPILKDTRLSTYQPPKGSIRPFLDD